MRHRYQDMMTPYEKFCSLPEAESYFKPKTTLKKLDAIAAECSDNDAAQRLNAARAKLFQSINNPNNAPPELYLINYLRSGSCLDWKILAPPYLAGTPFGAIPERGWYDLGKHYIALF